MSSRFFNFRKFQILLKIKFNSKLINKNEKNIWAYLNIHFVILYFYLLNLLIQKSVKFKVS